MAFSGGEVDASFAHLLLVAVGKFGDQFVHVRRLRGGRDVGVVDVGAAQAEVVTEVAAEEEDVLQDEGDVAA